MEEDLEKPVGTEAPSPSELSPSRSELCRRLDAFFASYSIQAQASHMFRGAIFGSQTIFRSSNLDWMAQAAHSLREILYPLCSPQVTAVPNMSEALQDWGSTGALDIALTGRVNDLFTELCNIAHHGVAPRGVFDFSTFGSDDFDRTLSKFEIVMTEALTRQDDVHKEFDDIIAEGPPA